MNRRSFLKGLVVAPIAVKVASDELVKMAIAAFNPRRVYFDMGATKYDLVTARIVGEDDFGWSAALKIVRKFPGYAARFENGLWQATTDVSIRTLED